MPKTPPPMLPIPSLQYDLFSHFVTNNDSAISNTIEFWECIPKYFLTPAQIKKVTPEMGQPDPYKWSYQLEGKSYTIIIQPAMLEEDDGSFKAYFPGATEELVEEALKKILSNQHFGIHDPNLRETWVRFTLSMIYRELKAKGRSRNRIQIKRAINIMARCVLTLYQGKKEIWSGSILQDLVTVDREEYLEDTQAYHQARLPLFVSHAIDRIEARQFNYERLMKCDKQLSRWIYKRLIHRYIQADYCNHYHFMYSDLKNSGLLMQSEETSNRKKVHAALEELKQNGVLNFFEVTNVKSKSGKSVCDVKYTISPSGDFIAEQKAANKRRKDNLDKASKENYTIPSVNK
ncbi:hypothetical protein [Sessilibacter corallicola]|uniref:Replication protein n=1 Tax=Sessilibacter corallicola TaxID=2904075 RepID=A0ABQ0A9Y5_9GAMM